MSVPTNRRHKSSAQYAMTAKLLAEKLYEIADNNPKRRDIRLNNPMALESAKVLKHAMNAYSTDGDTLLDCKYRIKQLKKSLNHMDMLESYLDIWWQLQERQLRTMPASNTRDEFERKRNNLYDQVGDMIVAYREEATARIERDRRLWPTLVSKQAS